jgi:hypothetical protein
VIDAHFADVARTDYVNYVGLEFAQDPADAAAVAPHQRVVAEAFIEVKGERSAFEFDVPDGAVCGRFIRVAAAKTEERITVALGVGGELAAGQRDAVDFFVSVGKESDSGRRRHLCAE